jgi:phosphatidate cytidylyltransferase
VLKQRVLTALVLLIVLLVVMLGLPSIATDILITLLVLVGAWEWAGFIGGGARLTRAGFTAVVAVSIAGAYLLGRSNETFTTLILVVALAWWFLAFLWVCFAPARVNALAATLAGLLTLVPCWFALFYMVETTGHTYWVLFTLALVWAADTGAFFAGRWLGRVPLAPRVSPKKTWEGALGGVALAAVVAWIAGRWIFKVDVAPFVLLCVGVAGLSIVGDLTESLLKRAAGLKDSGALFPGHGGMLDRIDSVTAAAPALLFGLIGLKVIA